MIVSFAPDNDPVIATVDARPGNRAQHCYGYDVLTRGKVGGMRRLYNDTRYLIILLSDGESLMFEDKRRCIYELMSHIGDKVGRKAGVVLRAPHEIEESLNAVRKDFPDLYARNIEGAIPCILVIEQDYSDFSPERDAWAVIKLSDLFDDAGRPNAKLSEAFAREFTKVVNAGDSIFEFLYNAHVDKNRSAFLVS